MMLKILGLTLLAAVCGCTGRHRDLTIVAHVDAPLAQSMDVTLMFKDGRSRIHVDASFGESIVIGLKTGEMILLIPPLKEYSKVPSQMFEAPVDSGKQAPGHLKESGIALKPTGKKAIVNGYPADEYVSGSDDQKTILWLTKAVPNYTDVLKELSKMGAFSTGMAASKVGPSAQRTALDWSALPGFPMRIVEEFAPGHTSTINVLSISNEPIADSEFAIPAGYKEEKFGIDAPD